MDPVSDYERELAAQVDAAIETRWQAAQDRHAAAMARIKRRGRRADIRFALVLLGCVVGIVAAAVIPGLLGW